MIRQPTVEETDHDVVDDRSMRMVEIAIAIVAAVAAGILALIR